MAVSFFGGKRSFFHVKIEGSTAEMRNEEHGQNMKRWGWENEKVEAKKQKEDKKF